MGTQLAALKNVFSVFQIYFWVWYFVIWQNTQIKVISRLCSLLNRAEKVIFLWQYLIWGAASKFKIQNYTWNSSFLQIYSIWILSRVSVPLMQRAHRRAQRSILFLWKKISTGMLSDDWTTSIKLKCRGEWGLRGSFYPSYGIKWNNSLN